MRRLIAPLLLLAACPPSSGEPPAPDELEAVAVTVVYEAGAEPYTGSAGPGQGDAWELFDANAAALMEGTGVSVSITSTLGAMTEFPADGVDAYTSSALIALAEEHGAPGGDGTTFGVVALWVDGRFESSVGEVQNGVLGVAIGNTGVIAMFKPVIESLGALEAVRIFGEQTVLIHEFGHAMGLVANPIDPIADHHDEANGAHCSNDRCVMYWANEGVGDLAEFVQQVVLTGETVIFDDDCLADAHAWYGAE